MNLLQYSNGWGHLIMSVAALGVGLTLVLFGHSTEATTTGVSMLTLVTSFWFISSGIKQFAVETNKTGPLPPLPSPPLTPGPGQAQQGG